MPWLATELAGHYYHPRLVALTHTVTLGWITLAIMGASYQMIPMVLERPIWSERLAWFQLGLPIVGVIGMVAHFYLAQWSGLFWAAGVMAAAVGAHLVNVASSLRGLTARLVTVAFIGLTLTTASGVVLAADRVWKFLPTPFFPTLHAHVHLALYARPPAPDQSQLARPSGRRARARWLSSFATRAVAVFNERSSASPTRLRICSPVAVTSVREDARVTQDDRSALRS